MTYWHITFSLQLLSIETILRHTDWTESAGDQSSVRIDRQIWPLLYTWGWTGMFGPINVTYNNKTQELQIYP
jgi:hypothetical protein